MENRSSSVPEELSTETERAARLYTKAGTERQRVRRACKACHTQKARCSGTIPVCLRCHQKGLACEYGPSKRSTTMKSYAATDRRISPARSLNVEPTTVLESAVVPNCGDYESALDCDEAMITGHIHAFFEYVACIPGRGFIHRAVLLRSWTQRKIHVALLQAVCSLSSAFISTDPHSKERAARWRDEAESWALKSLNRPSVTLAQVLLLIITPKDYAKTQTLLSIVVKVAYILRLNYENEDLSAVVRESRRRLMWDIFYMDKLYSGGFAEMSACPAQSMHIQLPCSQENFELGIPVATGSLFPCAGEESNMTYVGNRFFILRLCNLRYEILRFTRDLISRKPQTFDFDDKLKLLEDELQSLRTSLPDSMILSERNLYLRAYTPQLSLYAMLHIMWHQCHCDLYRMMIPGIRESLPVVSLDATPEYCARHYRQKAFEHALAILDIFQALEKLAVPKCIRDPTAAQCVYQCAKIIIRIKEMGEFLSEETGNQTLLRLKNAISLWRDMRNIFPASDEHVKEAERMIEQSLNFGASPSLASSTAHPTIELGRDESVPGILIRIRDTEASEENDLADHNIPHNSITGKFPALDDQPSSIDPVPVEIPNQIFYNVGGIRDTQDSSWSFDVENSEILLESTFEPFW